jgi:hypothetical protein
MVKAKKAFLVFGADCISETQTKSLKERKVEYSFLFGTADRLKICERALIIQQVD